MRYLLTATLFVGLLSSCSKERIEKAPEEKPVEKTVIFEVFSEKDYSQPEYEGTPYVTISAEVGLHIERYNLQTMKTEVIWDTVITRRMQYEYPLESNKLVIEKTVPVLNSKEHISVGKYISYRSSYGNSSYGSFDPVSREEKLRVEKVVL